MAPLKAEETLHDYLRRYFERISKGNARQFAEQNTVTNVDVVPRQSYNRSQSLSRFVVSLAG
jgi:hypothetical protein